MEIIKAKTAGFCFGVANAVKKAYAAAESEKEKRIYSYGSLIHNEKVIEQLSELGVRTINSFEEVDLKDAIVIIRAHGVGPLVYEKLEQLNCTVIDATCPYVKKIHNLVRKKSGLGDRIIIIGDRTHPEVIGINGWCDNSAIIIEKLEDVDLIENKDKTYSVVCQTTFNINLFEKICEKLKKSFDKLNIFDTICNATSLRQKEAMEIASKVDLMVVVGGRNSSNTRKLYELCTDLCDNVIHIESAEEMDVKSLKKINKVGVTAGASTPDWIIGEVIGVMCDDVKSIENEVNGEVENEITTTETNAEEVINETAEVNETATEVAEDEETSVAEEVAEEAVDEVADEAADEAEEEENQDNTFASMLEETLTTIASGQIVKGPINKIDVKGVYIDLGFKYEGFISIDEFTEIPGFELEDLNIGDEVEAMVVKVSDKDGEAILSKRRVDYKKNLQLLEDSFENKTPVTVRFTEVVKGGLIAHLGTIRIFVPSSQVSDKFVKDLSTYVGTSADIIIINFEKGPRGKMRIVGSRRVLVEAEKKEKEEAFWSKIEEGGVYKGIVKSFTPFGAFVDLGGYDGLVHISELSWKKIRHPKEVLKIGQEVDVKVLELDRENKKISLGYRKPEDNPWYDAENLYQVGDIIEVTVVRFVKFGVFVNIADGIDGLVHISQISNKRIEKAEDCLKLGQKVMAKIIDTNIEEKRINLSIRDVMPYDPEPKPGEEEAFEQRPTQRRGRKKSRKAANNTAYTSDTTLDSGDSRLVSSDEQSGTTTIGELLASKMQELTGVQTSDIIESEEN
jgi:4-hydroxy-3-methylbut-2-enyl diphosphate reductase